MSGAHYTNYFTEIRRRGHYHNYVTDIRRSFSRVEGLLNPRTDAGTFLKIERWRGQGWRVMIYRDGRPHRDLSPRLSAPKMVEWLGGFEEALLLMERLDR
jgi:hypothetical protein